MAQVEGHRNQLVEKYDNMKKFFDRREVVDHINQVIPKIASAQRLLGVALGAVRQNTDLLKCSQASLLAGIVQSLQLGLSLDPAMKQSHLVPFWNDKKKQYEATFIVGYQGYLDLARRAGEVAGVSAHVVYKSDFFVIKYGTDQKLEHIPNDDRPDGDPIRGAYVVYNFRNGNKEFDYMTWQDIEKRMAVSKAKQSGPWKEWVEEMAVKTVIRHSIKQVGISSDLARAAALEERALIGESQEDLIALPFELEEQPVQTVEEQKLEYEDMVKANIPQADRPTWDKFVEETAKANKKTTEETVLRIKNAFVDAMKAYEAWKASQPKPAEKPTPTAGATKPKTEAKVDKPKTNPVPEQPNPEAPSTALPEVAAVKCPNTGDMREIAWCNSKCPYSEGCPSLE